MGAKVSGIAVFPAFAFRQEEIVPAGMRMRGRQQRRSTIEQSKTVVLTTRDQTTQAVDILRVLTFPRRRRDQSPPRANKTLHALASVLKSEPDAVDGSSTGTCGGC